MREREPRVRLPLCHITSSLKALFSSIRARSSWSRERRMIIAYEDWTFLSFSPSFSFHIRETLSTWDLIDHNAQRQICVLGRNRTTKLFALPYLLCLLAVCIVLLFSLFNQTITFHYEENYKNIEKFRIYTFSSSSFGKMSRINKRFFLDILYVHVYMLYL